MDSDYQINELAKKAGVSVRTIRFYIDEGLLPTPQSRGRYSAYSDEYLERLELIRLLKDRFLPLKEIRRQVSGLDREEVKTALAREQAAEQAGESSQPAGQGEQAGSALDYIERLLRSSAPPKSSPGPAGPPPVAAQAPARLPVQPPAGLPPLPQDTWERIRLAPGLELHIQKPTSPQLQSQLEQLIDFARRLFNP